MVLLNIVSAFVREYLERIIEITDSQHILFKPFDFHRLYKDN